MLYKNESNQYQWRYVRFIRGSSGTYQETWNADGEFTGTTVPWQIGGQSQPDLTADEMAKAISPRIETPKNEWCHEAN